MKRSYILEERNCPTHGTPMAYGGYFKRYCLKCGYSETVNALLPPTEIDEDENRSAA